MARDQQNKQLPASRSINEQLILELSVEVEQRADRGDEDATERVLNSHPELIPNEELTISLLYAEIIAAEKNSKTPSEELFIHRFPALSERISRLFAFHQTVSQDVEHEELWESKTSLSDNNTDACISQIDTDHDTRIAFAGSSSRLKQIENEGFEILEKIGQGGMGVVYRARQQDLDRIVALKILKNPFEDSGDRQRLLNEAQAVARLKHSGIVQIHQVGDVHDQPYLCLEFIDGKHLGNRLAQTTMQSKDACELLRKVANAIAYAHEQGIVHRDLKPANILIDSAGEPKVADFGLAKFLIQNESQTADRLTQTGAVLGTICYMAPEQFGGVGEDVDHRADIYGLGTILYEMLVGRPPLIGNSPDETMYLVCTAEPTALRKLNPKIPRDVETICLKCLEKNPHRRFQSATELESELELYLAGRPLTIRPTSSITAASRWCKRRPAIALLSALSAALFIALTIGGYWIAWNQSQHALKLQEQSDLAIDAADLAAQKAGEAESVTQFMINTFGSAHPDRDGRNVTVAERLADGINEIDQTYPDDSTGKASLLSAIGKTYDGLGLLREAKSVLERAWQLFARLNGPRSIEALEAELAYANVLKRLGHYSLAEPHIVHSLEGMTEFLNPNSSDLILASNSLADIRFLLGDRQRGLDIYADCYDRAKKFLSPQDLVTIETANSYAGALIDVGELKKSSDLVNSVLPMATDVFGPGHLSVINLLNTSARIDRANGDYELAREKYQQIYDRLVQKLGADHVRTIFSLNGVAIIHADVGNHSKAIESMKEIRNQLARILGEHHPQTLRAALNVAKALEKIDRPNEARELLKTTYERAAQFLGRDNPDLMMLATNYGHSLARNNQFEEAEALLTQAVDYFRAAELADPIARAEPFLHLGLIYKRTDRIDQAIELYESALEIARDAYGESNPMTLSAKNNLAIAYGRGDRIPEAITLYVEVLEGLRQKLGPDHPHTLITGLNLAVTLRDENRADEAVAILEDIVPIFAREAQANWLACTAQFQLGRAYLDIGKTELATENLEQAFEGFQPLVDQQAVSAVNSLANQIKTISNQFFSYGEIEVSEIWLDRRSLLMGAVAEENKQ